MKAVAGRECDGKRDVFVVKMGEITVYLYVQG